MPEKLEGFLRFITLLITLPIALCANRFQVRPKNTWTVMIDVCSAGRDAYLCEKWDVVSAYLDGDKYPKFYTRGLRGSKRWSELCH